MVIGKEQREQMPAGIMFFAGSWYVADNAGTLIAKIIPHKKESENARLMGQSAELLAAVKELVENMPSNYPGDLNKFIDLIYKAEGKQ